VSVYVVLVELACSVIELGLLVDQKFESQRHLQSGY
jgi:hypothetical protein